MRINKLILFVLLIFLFNCGTGLALDSPAAVFIIIDQLGLEDLKEIETEAIDSLQQKGAFGLMNVRTAAEIKPESTYLTAGAGKKSKGSIYSLAGVKNDNGIVNPYITELKKINQNTGYSSHPGLLGSILVENGIKVAVIGNTDNINTRKRTITSMFMDSSGNIELGNVSKEILKEVNRPWGYGSDWEKIKACFVNYYSCADIIAIETGDITRLRDFRQSLTAEELTAELETTLINIDDFVGFVLKRIDLEQTVLGIIVPTPPAEDIKKGNSLSWLLLAGGDYRGGGWLISPSTRRKGLATLSDFLPTVLKVLDIERDRNFAGRALKVSGGAADWDDLKMMGDRIVRISRLRLPFIQGFIGLQLLVIILAIIGVCWRHFIIRPLFSNLILCLFLVPINFLLISHLNLESGTGYFVVLLIITFLEILSLQILSSGFHRVISVIFTLLIIITLDMFTGYRLQADSLLSYSSIIGARYYGLGNEYMGLYIGGGITFLSALMERYKIFQDKENWGKLFTLLFLFSLVFVTGLSGLGANFGGMLTALVAGTITWLKLWDYSFNWRNVITIFLGGMVLILLIIYVDYIRAPELRSHIGRVVIPLLEGDIKTLREIITRKLLMNLKLLRWTIWTRILLAFLVYLVVQFRHPVGRLKDIFCQYPRLAAGFYGGLSGAIVSMFVNDSGVVACATMLFYPLLFLLYLFPVFRE